MIHSLPFDPHHPESSHGCGRFGYGREQEGAETCRCFRKPLCPLC